MWYSNYNFKHSNLSATTDDQRTSYGVDQYNGITNGMVERKGNTNTGDGTDRGVDEEVWNWYCYDCRWRGVAQELKQDSESEEGWVCPKCDSIRIEDRGWHRGNEKWT